MTSVIFISTQLEITGLIWRLQNTIKLQTFRQQLQKTTAAIYTHLCLSLSFAVQFYSVFNGIYYEFTSQMAIYECSFEKDFQFTTL